MTKHRPIEPHILQRYREAYLRMVDEAGWHGLDQWLTDDVDKQATEYALAFNDEEPNFLIGTSNFDTNRAFIFTVEAARALACGFLGDAAAIKLLRMAIEEIEAAEQHYRNRPGSLWRSGQ
jgi:hypothetical protein